MHIRLITALSSFLLQIFETEDVEKFVAEIEKEKEEEAEKKKQKKTTGQTS